MVEPATRGGNWLDRHQSFLDRAKEGGIDLLFLGDSITDGWRNVGLETWVTHFEPLGAANFGLWGDATANLLWRIENGELDGITPRVTVILIGTNDIPWEVTDTGADAARRHTSAAVAQVVATVRSRLPATRILLLGIFPREEKPCLSREVIRSVNGDLALLDDGKHIHFLDVGHIFLEGELIPASIMPDTLHLSPAAYRLWGDAILPAVSHLLHAPLASLT